MEAIYLHRRDRQLGQPKNAVKKSNYQSDMIYFFLYIILHLLFRSTVVIPGNVVNMQLNTSWTPCPLFQVTGDIVSKFLVEK